MFKIFRNLFNINDKIVEHPHNYKWMLNNSLKPKWDDLRECKEFHDLIGCKQSTVWHGEGDVWNHTVLVAKEMYIMLDSMGWIENKRRDAEILMIAALCHDLGKPSTTYLDEEDNDWHCKNHGEVGEHIVRNLLIDADINTREEICWLVRHHMDFHYIDAKPRTGQINKILKLSQGSSSIEKLLMLNVADNLGSRSQINSEELSRKRVELIQGIANEYGCYQHTNKEPIVNDGYHVYMMIGIAGSGKDTYIQKFLPDLPTICRDEIRDEITNGKTKGHKVKLSKQDEATVTRIANERIIECCKNRRNFVINQTNLKKKYREETIALIKQYGNPQITFVYVEAPKPIEDCIKRREGEIPMYVIQEMWNKLDFPDESECDELIKCKEL